MISTDLDTYREENAAKQEKVLLTSGDVEDLFSLQLNNNMTMDQVEMLEKEVFLES